jgi:hypothetical protein
VHKHTTLLLESTEKLIWKMPNTEHLISIIVVCTIKKSTRLNNSERLARRGSTKAMYFMSDMGKMY